MTTTTTTTTTTTPTTPSSTTTTPSSTTTTPSTPQTAPTPAQQKLADALAAVEQARRAVQEEQACAARAVKIARINARIDVQMRLIGSQLDALRQRADQLAARRITQQTQQTQQAASGSTPARGGPAGTGERRWDTPRYRFWRSYNRAHKDRPLTQSALTALCTKHGIVQTDPADPASLQRIHDLAGQ